jgi:hypothetical protein
MLSDTPAVTVFLDRLMHNAHLIQLRGKTYRLRESSVSVRGRKGAPPK